MTLRNDSPNATEAIYVEVAVYVANASTGLSWPINFGNPPLAFGNPLPGTQRLITIHLKPGEVTDIGPLPWTPPSPVPSDHWCLYIRVLSPQDFITISEGPNVNINTQDSNNIAWRNIKIVQASPFGELNTARFIIRNIHREDERIDLQFTIPERLLEASPLELELEPAWLEAWRAAGGTTEGMDPTEQAFLIFSPNAGIFGIPMGPFGEGAASVRLRTGEGGREEHIREPIDIVQMSRGEVDGGITLLISEPKVVTERSNLTVKIAGPTQAKAGEELGELLDIVVDNSGNGRAAGTVDIGDLGYMVDLVLSQDDQAPLGFAAFSPTFQEDTLLGGGRVSNTQGLNAGESISYRAGAHIPEDTPAGTYCLFAIVDPGQSVDETNEEDNLFCHLIEIVAADE